MNLHNRQHLALILAAVAALIACLSLTGCYDPFEHTRPEPEDTPENLQIKSENARLIADIERIKAEGQAEQQRLLQEVADAQKTADMERAAKEETLKQDTYSANKWLGMIIVAAIACVAYCYKRLSFLGAFLGFIGFGGLFCLVLAGKYYPQYLPFAPLVLCPIMLYAAHRAGILKDALATCCRGIEFAEADGVKSYIRNSADGAKVELVRKDIDAAAVQLARARHHNDIARRNAETVVMPEPRDEIERAESLSLVNSGADSFSASRATLRSANDKPSGASASDHSSSPDKP